MELKSDVIKRISESTRTMNLLAVALDCSVFTIQRYLKGNSDNLTKAVALKVIRKELKLKDAEILDTTTA